MFGRLYRFFSPQFPLSSYSQSGEDIIVQRVLGRMGVKEVRYLDIGANDPVRLNNTYLLYKKGGRGVLVEPDPALCRRLSRRRKGDVVLQAGIGSIGSSEARLYCFDNAYLNTFSREEADKIEQYGKHRVVRTETVRLLDVNTILADYFDHGPDFLSLDVEGFDLEILAALDFNRFRPRVLCVETLIYTEDNTEKKREEIFSLMEGNGYLLYGDTYINSIFVDREKWRNRIR
ncbi:MAG: FkbM family methyltransferase [Thermodesulfobacteriota bacterium]